MYINGNETEYTDMKQSPSKDSALIFCFTNYSVSAVINIHSFHPLCIRMVFMNL